MRITTTLLLVALACLIATSCAQIVNFIDQGGNRYATLDNVAPAIATVSSQETPVAIPNGWELAQPSAAAQQAASGNFWGTDCLVLADGSMTPSRTGIPCTNGLVASDAGFRALTKRVLIQLSPSNMPTVLSVNPPSGILAGGQLVTVLGRNLGSGSDITSVTLAGVAATIVSQTNGQVMVTTGPATAATSGPVIIRSTSVGTVQTTGVTFTYSNAPLPVIRTVQPATAPRTGITVVTIAGDNLGSGTDITAVLIGRVPTEIVSQSATQVVVRVVMPGSDGSIEIRSTSVGTTRRDGLFSFKNSFSISSIVPTSGVVAGGNLVTVLANGLVGDVNLVQFANQTATIISQTTSSVVVTAPSSPVGPTVVGIAVNSASLGSSRTTFAYEYALLPYVDVQCPCADELATIALGDSACTFCSLE